MHLVEHKIEVVEYPIVNSDLRDFGHRALFNPVRAFPRLSRFDHFLDLFCEIGFLRQFTTLHEGATSGVQRGFNHFRLSLLTVIVPPSIKLW